MQTILHGKTSQVTLDTEGGFVIIGESINPTRRKKLIESFQQRDFDYVFELAQSQIDAGADVLDVNVGYPGVDDVSLLPEVVKAIMDRFDVPLCLDSPNPKALEAALKVAPPRSLVNSVNGEEKSLESILPIVKEYNAAVIGLVMDDDGISIEVEKRVAIAGKIIDRAAKYGIPVNDVVIDPLVMAVSADSRAALVTLQTIEEVRKKFGVSITMGASNVSFGLPERQAINDAFMAIAMSKGANSAITNPVHLAYLIRAADVLLGHDEYAARYIRHHRKQQKLMQAQNKEV